MAKLAIDGGDPVRTTPFPGGKDIGEEELLLVKEVIESRLLNRTGGSMTPALEKQFAEHYGVAHCTASTSGTSAIHVAVGAVNPNPCDEIITAPITDMGTVIPILAQNAIPVFADVDPRTYNVTPESIEERITDRTVAIIVVHLFGNACDMDPILEIARAREIVVIEDSSQAYGTMYKGKRCGTIGDIGTFSLQASKHITAGDGGLTITNDDHYGERCRLFADKGWPRYSADGARDYLCFGFNYRMTELTAAVGLAQLGKVDDICGRRTWAGDLLSEKLRGIPGLTPPTILEGCVHTYWQYAMHINEHEMGMSAKRFAEAVSAEGLGCGAGYIGCPIFMYEAVRTKKIYGNSLCPFNCETYGGRDVPYGPGYCPQTEQALDEMALTHVNEFFEESDVEDAATIIRKVAGAG